MEKTIILGICMLIVLTGCNQYDNSKYGKIIDIRFPENDGYFKIGEKADMLVEVRSYWTTTLVSGTCTIEQSECVEIKDRGGYIMPNSDGYFVPKVIISNNTYCIDKKIKLEVCWKDKAGDCPTRNCFDKKEVDIKIIR